jgi:hypothetical protein
MRLRESQFIAWLRAKPPVEIVGENRDCHSCPIAKFYYEASGGCEIVIFDRWGDHFIDRGYSQRRMPVWASAFVFEVDGDASGKITAGRALEVLGACGKHTQDK